MSAVERRARFRELHARDRLFLLPNPWDAGSARLLAAAGFEALATTSAGLAWSLGEPDQHVSLEELVSHVAALAAATDLPLSVDSERCFGESLDGVAETVERLAAAGAAGCSIEDYDPARGAIDDTERAAERVAAAAEAAHRHDLTLTARAESHLYGGADLGDTIDRLVAYRDAGADVVYAPGLTRAEEIAALVEAVAIPLNVLLLPGMPPVTELEAIGVRRVSTGSGLASAAYGALLAAARELTEEGTAGYMRAGLTTQQRTVFTGTVAR
jgi:2-methylisocitrate lyase-like PEP mutase family enzyme